MNSLMEDDTTLPLDFNGSSNPDQLRNVFMDETAPPVIMKAGSGRMSPALTRTMKEYDQLINDLKKENFSLKLRIYFLEEKAPKGEAEMFRTNIELKVDVETLKKELREKQELLQKASDALESMTGVNQDAPAEVTDLQRQVVQLSADLRERREAFAKLDEEARKRSGELESLQNLLAKQGDVIANLEDAMHEKEADLKKLEDILREREEEITENEQRLRDVEKLNKTHEENALKRDNAIKGLADMVHSHEVKLVKYSKSLEEKDSELKEAKSQLLKFQTNQYQGLETQILERSSNEDRINELEAALSSKSADFERLQRSLKRSEAEVKRLVDDVEKSDQLVREREDSMQELRLKLQELRREANTKAQTLDSQYQALLDDAQRQIGNQEKMLQRMTTSLQDKDKQLQHYLELIQQQEPDSPSKDSILNNLRQQLQNKEKSLEDAIEEKFRVLEERDTEVRQLKLALREKEHDLERANHMLLTTEEAIDILENENKEKESNARQQQMTLKTQERNLQELKQSQASALQEKESLIQKLRQSLAHKDRDFSEVVRDSSAADTDAVLQQMQATLKDKDALLEELMTERTQASETHQRSISDLQLKLRQRDQEQKETEDAAKGAEMSLKQQLQHLQTELNEKEFELSKVESRSAWAGEQQQEILDKLKEALNEKNRTIEVLVESAQEKDTLLSQMRDTSSSPHDTNASKLAELQKLKDEVAMLSNELQNKDSLIDRLRAANERRSPKLDMVPRHRHQEIEEDLDQRTKNELREEIEKQKSVEEDLRNDLTQLQQQIRDSPSKTAYDSFSNSYLPSFNPLPDPSLIPDDGTLCQMSLPQVRGIIQGLRSQLSSPKRHSSSSINNDELLRLREENQKLTWKLHLVLYGPASDRDVRIIPVLKQELEDARSQLSKHHLSRDEQADVEAYETEIQELKAKLNHTENINEVLRKQMGSQKERGSNEQLQIEALQNTLASTEATVRSQSDKMKQYRSLLEEAGLLTSSPLPHGHSDSNLASPPLSKTACSKSSRLEASLQRLSKQQENSAETASALSQRLEEVNEYVSELLHQDCSGEVDVMDVTPDRVSQLKETLNAARSLLDTMQQAPDDVDATVCSSSMDDLAKMEQPLQELQAERQLLLCKVEVLDAEVTRMQQEVLKERERTNAAEKEAKRVQEEKRSIEEEWKKLSEELQEEERSTEKLRAWLKENQAREEMLRQELSRMNGEVDSRNSTIETLQQKLQSVQEQRQQQQQQPPPSSPNSLSSRRSLSPIERARHPTSTSTILDSMHTNGTVHSPPSRQGISELESLPSTEDHRPSIIQPVFRISDPSPKEMSITEYAQELSKLKFRLNAMDTMNQSLRQELHVYDNIQNSSSVGIQNCASMSHDASQTFMTDTTANNSSFFGLEGHLYEIRQLQNALMDSLRQNDELRIQLQQKLASLESEPQNQRSAAASAKELEAKQHRIDILVRDLDLVKTQLTKQTNKVASYEEKQSHHAASSKELEEKQRRIDVLVRDLDLVKTQLSVQTSEKGRHQAMCEKLEAEVSEMSQRIKSMDSEKVAADSALKVANSEFKRMKSCRDSLKQQLREQADLNTTLKLEMSIYEAAGLDDPHFKTGTGHVQHDNKSLNRLLLQQMRQLRKQLEKSIHNNNQLRRDLETYMHQRKTPDLFRNHEETASGDTMFPQQYDLLRETSASLPSEALLSGQVEAHMRYSALDAKRPPSDVGSRLRMSTGSHCTGLSPNRIGSDLRSLYAVGSLDDYELLKKQTAESQIALAGADAIIKERLASFRTASPSQNAEYNTLRQLSTRLSNLRTISEEERRLVALFWLTQLPVRDEKGNFVDLKLARENQDLQRRLLQAQNNVQHLKDGMESAIGKMASDLRHKKEATGQHSRKNQQDDRVIDALSAHLKVLCQASRNLESTRDGSKS